MTGDKKELCTVPTCGARQKVSEDGVCLDCDPFTKASDTKKECVQPTCEARSKLTEEAECVVCDDHTILDVDLKTCIKPTNCSELQKILVDGTCADCLT